MVPLTLVYYRCASMAGTTTPRRDGVEASSTGRAEHRERARLPVLSARSSSVSSRSTREGRDRVGKIGPGLSFDLAGGAMASRTAMRGWGSLVVDRRTGCVVQECRASRPGRTSTGLSCRAFWSVMVRDDQSARSGEYCEDRVWLVGCIVWTCSVDRRGAGRPAMRSRRARLRLGQSGVVFRAAMRWQVVGALSRAAR